MKKVAIIINEFNSGGSERAISLLLPSFIKSFNVKLIVITDEELFYPIPESVEVIRLSKKINSNFLKILMLPLYAYKLKKIVKKQGIDIIQSHLFRASYVNILAKVFGSKHRSQVVSSTIASRYEKEGISGKLSLFFIKKLFPKADKIIFKSKGMQKDFSKFIKIKNFHVINNPYDIQRLTELANESCDFVFNGKTFYIASLGRLIPLKRCDELIRALKKVKEKKDEEIHLIFIGDGPERENLINLSHELNLEKKVHFVGIKKNPFPYLFKSNLFVMSSETEGFPNALVEAISLGTPAISSDCISGPREILNETYDYESNIPQGCFMKAKHGILYPVGDVDALSNAILFLMNNERVRSQLAENGKKRAEDFSIEKVVTKYLELVD